MNFSLFDLLDLIGTIAFAISGAAVGIRNKMDVFGVVMLGGTTACGGGVIRDLLIGNTPPNMFKNPFYAGIAISVALLVFILRYRHKNIPEKMSHAYDRMLFWFDTLGLAAFAVDGVVVGLEAGYEHNHTLLVFLGFLTGVGGGLLRDIMADQKPDIFVKHIYALAAITGALLMVLVLDLGASRRNAMVIGFTAIIILRYLAKRYEWNLPVAE